MNGILIINKPKDYTSRDIVNIVGKKLHTKKVGHAGTLDPLATGVLVVGVNKGTKLLNKLTLEQKEYEACVKMGIKTDTYDIAGNILEENKKFINKEQLKKCLKLFKKTYFQEVPIYSATKINGKKLYKYARENKTVELPKKEVTIYDIKLLEVANNTFSFYTKVSKGTYIRSLINDLSIKTDTLMTMSDLKRISQGKFIINDAINLDEINEEKIIPILKILDCEVKEIDENIKKYVINGNTFKYSISKKYVLFLDNDKEIALYEKADGEMIKNFIMF